MKKVLFSIIITTSIFILFGDAISQQRYTYTRPRWLVEFGPAWNLATNDAYGRANYAQQSQVLADNYGMRWGYGGFITGKYAVGKTRHDRIFLGFDYKGMANSDWDSEGNSTFYDLITIDAGYEYLFYGTYGFRSYYGIGLTGNVISGSYTPNVASATNVATALESSFRVGMELKAGLEFVLNTSRKNLGITVGGKYNLMNLFNDQNGTPSTGQTENLNWNDGDGQGGPGFKRYIGIVSVEVGLSIYPDVKKVIRK